MNPPSELRTVMTAPAIAGLLAPHGGSVFAHTVPEIAPGAATLMVAVAELLAVFGSMTVALTCAVLLRVPEASVTLTKMITVALAPLASVSSPQVTVPVPPRAGVVHEPGLAVALTNVVPPGSGSETVTPGADAGPALVTVSSSLQGADRKP